MSHQAAGRPFRPDPPAAGRSQRRRRPLVAFIRMDAYNTCMGLPAPSLPPELPRVELYRLLGDAGRLRLYALCAAEELSVGEIADILEESQPQISRRSAPLRDLGLLTTRKDGTRTYLRAAACDDPVVKDALLEGRRLCEQDGSLAKLPAVVAAREESTQRFFDDDNSAENERAAGSDEPNPFLAHLAALAPLLPHKKLAVDVGCGDGFLLDVLAPLYDRVIAVDRSPAQLARAARRVRERGLSHVRLFNGRFDDAELYRQVDEQGGACLVYASRVLHHSSRPAQALSSFSRLLREGGHLVLLDYLPHDDESLRAMADVWLGFPEGELARLCKDAGLEVLSQARVPDAWHPAGPDGHLHWQALVARRPLLSS